MTDTSELFVDLLDATMRSSRNYHRLDHCSHVDGSRPKSIFRFKEETITDLLIGELAGREYEVSAACPVCGPDSQCSDWNGDPARSASGMRIRALTNTRRVGTGGPARRAPTQTSSLPSAAEGLGRGRRRADARELRSWSRLTAWCAIRLLGIAGVCGVSAPGT
jgi:hypothetical protein